MPLSASSGRVYARSVSISEGRSGLATEPELTAELARVAGQLEQDSCALVGNYETELRRIDSPLLLDELARTQCLEHARFILDEVVKALRAESWPADRKAPSILIGATRGASGVHPAESLRAAGVLFDVVARHVGEFAPRQAMTVVLHLNQVLTRAVSQAAEGYAGSVLDRIHRAHVEERRRVGRDLHDRIGHGVNLAYRSLELFDLYRERDPSRALAQVEKAQQALWTTHGDLRDIITAMRMSEPLESLEKALRGLLETAGDPQRDGLLEFNGDEFWAPPEIRDEVFLIIREALRNVLSHAEATQVLVRVDVAPNELRATATDDGVGFDPKHRPARSAGLGSMQERAAAMSGSVTITSDPGHGTRVRLWVPLAGGRPDADEPGDG
jgi:signal transduction histidine kinase